MFSSENFWIKLLDNTYYICNKEIVQVNIKQSIRTLRLYLSRNAYQINN